MSMTPGFELAKEFLLGAILMGDLVLMLFFLRYWKVTGDRLFLFFALSFAIGAFSRLLLAANVVGSESEPLVYLIRIVSYSFILAGIVDTNRDSIWKALFQRS